MNHTGEEAFAIIQDVYAFLNKYGEDPYNMGKDPRSQASISPHAIIGEVYVRLVPLYNLLEQENQRIQDTPSSFGEAQLSGDSVAIALIRLVNKARLDSRLHAAASLHHALSDKAQDALVDTNTYMEEVWEMITQPTKED